MGVLNEAIADADLAFVDTDIFGESVTYTKSSGATRTINAVVLRKPPEPLPGGATQSLNRSLRVKVLNSGTRGISSSEIDPTDTLDVVERIGEAATTFSLAGSMANHDHGMVTLNLR